MDLKSLVKKVEGMAKRDGTRLEITGRLAVEEKGLKVIAADFTLEVDGDEKNPVVGFQKGEEDE